jgi:putative oxidoreductase
MTLVRRLARPMLAAIFIGGGLDALRNPAPKVSDVEDVAHRVATRIPGLEDKDTEQLIKINAGVQVGAGALFALGRFPRLSALALAATLLSTTAAAHRFWEEDDPDQRTNQQIHFFKNMGVLGGLLLAAVDTEGRPGLAWRASHAAEHVSRGSRRRARSARREAKLAKGVARHEARMAGRAVRAHLPG